MTGILITKWIGLEGTVRLVSEKEQELLERFPAAFLKQCRALEAQLSTVRERGIAEAFPCVIREVADGGIFAALWELAEEQHTGLTVALEKLPVRQETIEVCEFFGLDPYVLPGGGSLLIASEAGEGLAQALTEAGVPVFTAGYFTEGNQRVVTHGDGVRFLTRPRPDEGDKVKDNA